ncbi:nucleoside diphosphate kinase [Nannochloropsis oceanica]
MFSSTVRRCLQRTAGVRAFSSSMARASASSAKGASVQALGGLALVAAGAAWAAQEMRFGAPAHCSAAAKVPHTGLPGTDKERTFIAIKPDGVQRGLIAAIIARFENKGFKLVGMKMLWPTKAKAESHYSDLSTKPFFAGLVAYFSSGPIIAMVWEGKDAIKTGRVLLGATNPAAAVPGTIRGDMAISVGRNICHGSDGPESAVHEIGNWFTEAEISDYTRSLDEWIVADN